MVLSGIIFCEAGAEDEFVEEALLLVGCAVTQGEAQQPDCPRSLMALERRLELIESDGFEEGCENRFGGGFAEVHGDGKERAIACVKTLNVGEKSLIGGVIGCAIHGHGTGC